MQKKRSALILKYIGYVILIAGLFWVIREASTLSIDGHHDGTVYNPASIVAKGGILFRDTSTYYGPLMVYIQAFFLKVFGNNLLSLRLSAVVFYVAAFVLYFNIFKRIIPRFFVILSEIILLFIAPFWMTTFLPWSSVYALVMILGIIYCAILYIETDKNGYIFSTGVLSVFTLLIRTPVGCVFTFATFVMWLCVSFRRIKEHKNNSYMPLILFFAGFIGGIIPFLILFGIQGTIAEWWESCIAYTFRAVADLLGVKESNAAAAIELAAEVQTSVSETFTPMERLLQDLFPLKQSGVFVLMPVASLIVFFYTLYRMFLDGRNTKENFEAERACSQKRVVLIIIAWFSLASWHQYYGVSEIRHWYWGGFPMFGLLAYLLYFMGGQFIGKWRIFAAAMLLLSVSATTLQERYSYFQERQLKYLYMAEKEVYPQLEGLKLSKEQLVFYREYDEIISALRQTHPERYVDNRTFNILLQSLSNNDSGEIDKELPPIIISNNGDLEEFPEHFLAVEMEQSYPEQELDPQQFRVSFYLPNEW